MTLTTLIYKNFQLDYEITVDVCSIDGFAPELQQQLLTNKKAVQKRIDPKTGVEWEIVHILHLENDYKIELF